MLIFCQNKTIQYCSVFIKQQFHQDVRICTSNYYPPGFILWMYRRHFAELKKCVSCTILHTPNIDCCYFLDELLFHPYKLVIGWYSCPCGMKWIDVIIPYGNDLSVKMWRFIPNDILPQTKKSNSIFIKYC